jgi:hypothetical protein
MKIEWLQKVLIIKCMFVGHKPESTIVEDGDYIGKKNVQDAVFL